MRNRKNILVAVVASAAALVLPAAASAKLLDDYYNEGIEPHADLGEPSRSIAHPRQIRVEFSGHTPAQINGRYTVKCFIGKKPRFSRSRTASGISPVVSVLRIKRRFNTCRVTAAEARFADPFISGWLRVRVFGN